MKLTKTKLKQLIKEELKSVLKEQVGQTECAAHIAKSPLKDEYAPGDLQCTQNPDTGEIEVKPAPGAKKRMPARPKGAGYDYGKEHGVLPFCKVVEAKNAYKKKEISAATWMQIFKKYKQHKDRPGYKAWSKKQCK